MTTWTRQAERGWYILRYHHPSQLARRLASMARRRYEEISGGGRYAALRPSSLAVRIDDGLIRLAAARWHNRPEETTHAGAARLLEGSFRFLGVQRRLPDPIDWRLESWPEAPHLWRFHLHYHEFLLDLAAAHSRRVWEVVSQWIDNNRLTDPRVYLDAWHPYCISRRLPAWISLWIGSPPEEPLRDRALASLFSQTAYLAGHLERDLGGNHLLENLRALLVAACFLDCPEAERWRNLAARLLRRELPAQILPHGEHFERSPMYHAAMLDAVLDIRDAAGELLPETARLAADVARRMARFLQEIRHPDGEIPLLADSCFGEIPTPSRLLSRTAAIMDSDVPHLSPRPLAGEGPGVRAAGRKSDSNVFNVPMDCTSSPQSRRLGEYWIYRDPLSFVLFDAGPVGPDHLPAHAHADLLTFEASFRGSRLFVDSGIGSYQDDADRRYGRSTAAHNVLQIDGADHCDMWSKFRMGYRGRPSGLTVGETSGFFWAHARHNAYRRLGVPSVGRWFACRPGGPWICVDWAEGKRAHHCANRLHLHPDVKARQTADNELGLVVQGSTLKLSFFTPGEIAIEEGWYYPTMGIRQTAPVICWTACSRLPTVCGWSLTWGSDTGIASLDVARGGDVRLHWSEDIHSVEVRLPSLLRH